MVLDYIHCVVLGSGLASTEHVCSLPMPPLDEVEAGVLCMPTLWARD